MSLARLFLAVVLLGCLVSGFGQQAQRVSVAIDATKAGAPIPKFIYGGFMEPATTQIWAEMLYDRKFAYPVSSKDQPSAAAAGGMRQAAQNPWRPIGPDESVVMDT